MSVTLNVGYSRKVGEPNFGSRGASVSIQVDANANLGDGSHAVRGRIRKLFELARTAVDEELSRSAADRQTPKRRNGTAHEPSAEQRITTSQLHAIRQLCRKAGIDEIALLQQQGYSGPLEQLTRQQASRLIAASNAQTPSHRQSPH